VIITAHPEASVFVDGAALGTSSGLRVGFSKPSGELRLGNAGPEAISFNYIQKTHGIALKPLQIGARTVLVDGELISAAKPKAFNIDQRPRRIEIVDVEGKKQVILVKLSE
jgi:hypothetical protein